MLGGLDKPRSGTVEVEGKNIFSLKDDALTIFRRRKIGFIFQSYSLMPVLNVYENIVLPIELDGNMIDKKHIDNIIETLIATIPVLLVIGVLLPIPVLKSVEKQSIVDRLRETEA